MIRVLTVFAVLVLAALAIWHPAPRPAIAVESTPSPRSQIGRSVRRFNAAAPQAAAVVYVVGAVARPGLYRVVEGARIDDAVRAAGGMRADANPAGVNLAAHASDGDEILVPRLGDSVPRSSRTRGARSSAKTHAIVEVNDASAQMLASVPGIGATIAARIVEIRERDGAFTSLDELLDVAGMTPRRLDVAQRYLRV